MPEPTPRPEGALAPKPERALTNMYLVSVFAENGLTAESSDEDVDAAALRLLESPVTLEAMLNAAQLVLRRRVGSTETSLLVELGSRNTAADKLAYLQIIRMYEMARAGEQQ